jgi:hypothetical protein
MITRAGDIYCEQGESFTVGFRIVNPDGSPFVLSDALDDATHKSYLLFTVASSANVTGKSRYLANHWNPTDKYKKFYSTQAVKLADNDGEWPTAASVWSTVKNLIPADANVTPANYAIYYIVKSDGTKDYKQLTGTEAEPSLEPYSFYFFQQFTKEQSNKWTQSGYDYALKVVAGSVNPEGSARPINIDFSYPLIGAHKLYVDSNVQGSIEDVEVVNE